MTFPKILMILLIVAVPYQLGAEVVHLKDGSTLVGKLVKIDGDTLYFEPSFGGRVKLAKKSVWKILFSDSIPAETITGNKLHPTLPETKSAEPGSLIVLFDGIQISNKIVVHRKRDRTAHERANSIESILMIDGLPVASYVDSTTDKVIRDGPDTILKNTIKLSDFHVKLNSGIHSCRIIVRNIKDSGLEDDFEHEPLNLNLKVGDIIIYPGRNSKIEVGLKRGRWSLGKPKLYVK